MGAVKGLAMEKWLCWGSLGISGILLLLFLLDLVLKIPFGGTDVAGMMIVDICGLLAAGVIGYLAWESSRDYR